MQREMPCRLLCVRGRCKERLDEDETGQIVSEIKKHFNGGAEDTVDFCVLFFFVGLGHVGDEVFVEVNKVCVKFDVLVVELGGF